MHADRKARGAVKADPRTAMPAHRRQVRGPATTRSAVPPSIAEPEPEAEAAVPGEALAAASTTASVAATARMLGDEMMR